MYGTYNDNAKYSSGACKPDHVVVGLLDRMSLREHVTICKMVVRLKIPTLSCINAWDLTTRRRAHYSFLFFSDNYYYLPYGT